MKNKIKLLILAVVLRLLVSGFLFHPDIKTIAFQTSFLKNGVTDIYNYLSINKSNLPIKEDFVYFPLTYFTIGGYQAVLSTILGSNFDKWVSNASTNGVVNSQHIISYLLLLKLPLLVMDIAIAFLLLNLFKKKEDGEKAFTVWLFNPFTIILIYAFSNIDLYAVLLTLIAFLYLKKDKLVVASIFIGLAISFKLYPLLFVPFIFLKSKNIKEKALSVGIPVLIFLITIIPFWSEAFVKSALLSGLSTRIFNPNFTIGFGESLILGLFLMTILFFYSLLNNSKVKIFNYFVILLFILFSLSHFHVSWLLWIAPFLVILVVKRPKLVWPIFFWSALAIVIPMLYSDRSMTISLFRIYTTWYDLLPTPFQVVEKYFDPFVLQSMMHSILAGISTVISFKLIKDE